MNRLADAPSPYLRQHAGNPVHWWEWSDDAFAEAARRDVPVFLSIGYATCHWCHVMAHESFEDAAVAAVLNDAFVCVKVDREERPDVDALYMAVCVGVLGHGGWPLTVVLTPDRRPFYVATYLPPQGRHGRAGVVELAGALSEAWRTRRADVEAAAADLTGFVQQRFAPPPPAGDTLGAGTLDAAFASLQRAFDATHGGWGVAPKFPSPHVGRFVLRHAHRRAGAEGRAMVVATLEAMQRGGLRDHLGGGFHRYSTDRAWHLPHFEKMLYDQAGLLLLYAEAAAALGRADFAETARGVFAYLMRDLRHPDGAFFCAEDADSARPDGTMHEGAFYVWTTDALRDVLGASDAALFARLYGFEERGNFDDEATRRRTGENVLHLSAPVVDLAPRDEAPEAFAARVAAMRAKLFDARAQRPRPLRDDKVLADWNGLAASALLRAGRALGDDAMVAAGRDVLRFVRTCMCTPAGALLHRFHGDRAGIAAFADDYAFVVRALLDAFEADGAAEDLVLARGLTRRLVDGHWDEAAGLFRLAAHGTSGLVAAPADRHDGAMPSGNAVACLNLLHLARLTGDADLERLARRMLSSAAAEIAAHPPGFAAWLLALDELVHGAGEVVVAGQGDAAAALLSVARAAAPPGTLIVPLRAESRTALADVAPSLAAFAVPAQGACAYVCRDFRCEAPVSDVEALRAALAPAA